MLLRRHPAWSLGTRYPQELRVELPSAVFCSCSSLEVQAQKRWQSPAGVAAHRLVAAPLGFLATALLSHWGLWFSWPRGLPEPEATAAAQVRSCGNGEGHSQLELPCGRFTATDRAADGSLSFKHWANESGTVGGGWGRAWRINIMSLGRSVRRVSAPGSGRGRLPCHRLVVERAAVSAAVHAGLPRCCGACLGCPLSALYTHSFAVICPAEAANPERGVQRPHGDHRRGLVDPGCQACAPRQVRRLAASWRGLPHRRKRGISGDVCLIRAATSPEADSPESACLLGILRGTGSSQQLT